MDVIDSFPAFALHVKLGDAPSLDEIRGALFLVVENRAGVVLMVFCQKWLRFPQVSC